MPVWLRSRLRYPAVLLPRIQTVTQKVLSAAGRPKAIVSLDFVGDLRMQRLNRRYRGYDAATDVLAFATPDGGKPRSCLLGDVVISLHTAERQAAQYGFSVDEEITKLIIHGILHLFGYDHERSERDARRMRRKEQAIFRSLMPLPRLVETRKRRYRP